MSFERKQHASEWLRGTVADRLVIVLNPALEEAAKAVRFTDRAMALESEHWAALAEQQGMGSLDDVTGTKQQRSQAADMVGRTIAQEETGIAESDMLARAEQAVDDTYLRNLETTLYQGEQV